MSSNKNEHIVNMVHIRQLDTSNTITYKNRVTIVMLFDSQRPLTYLRIKSDEKTIYTQELGELQWVHESSTDGVTTIRSTKKTVVIIYDPKNELLVDFFASLQISLTNALERKTSTVDYVSLQSNSGQLESMIDHLIKSIHSGASNDVEHITKELAKSRANVRFNLITKNDNEEINMVKSKSNNDVVESPDYVLRLSLRIECPLGIDPIIASIDVLSGTTLQSLKQKIEKETGIEYADQYWFAFDRYPISDDYIFGSSVSFSSNQNQQGSLVKPIQCGDTLIMYIAQMSSIIKIKI